MLLRHPSYPSPQNYSKEQYLVDTIELPKTLELAEQFELPKRPYPIVDGSAVIPLTFEANTQKMEASIMKEILFDE